MASAAPAAAAAARTISERELARHASDQDAWIAIGGAVYDITGFMAEHPGGRGVLHRYLGRDGTYK